MDLTKTEIENIPLPELKNAPLEYLVDSFLTLLNKETLLELKDKVDMAIYNSVKKDIT